MKKLYYLVIAVISVMLLLSMPITAVAKEIQKNILLIVLDDMGIDAMQLYTDQLDLTPEQRALVPPTPTIDSLAAEGITFNNAWANAQCSPTRGTIMTGKNAFQTGITKVVGLQTEGGGPEELDVHDPELLPKVLKKKGYATALIGKWHLTSNSDMYNANDDPNEAGFDYFSGFLAGALIWQLGAPDEFFGWPQIINGSDEVIQTRFATTDNVDRGVEFIKKVPHGKPWFLSMNFAAPHWDYDTPPKHLVDPDIVKQVEDAVNAEAGWENWEYEENYVVARTGPPNPRQLPNTLLIRRAVFNALISAMDMETARLLKHVDLKKTCVIVVGDNGTQGPPNPRNSVVDPFPPDKAKSTLYEGGVRVPLIVYGPRIKNPGRYADTLVNTADLYAMILKIAGCPNPDRYDGREFSKVFRTTHDVRIRDFIFAELDNLGCGNAGEAIRGYRYKVIHNKVREVIDGDCTVVDTYYEFYDLYEDPWEENDLLMGELTYKQDRYYNYLMNKLDEIKTTEH